MHKEESELVVSDKAVTKKVYERPVFVQVKLEGERAVLGACFTVSTGCDTYRY